MSKNIKKLELSFQEFVVLEDLNLPDWSFLKVATEIKQNGKAIKYTYSSMEELNKSLLQKLILVDRANKVKAVLDLTAQLETYFEKWVTVKNENAKTPRKTDGILLSGWTEKINVRICFASFNICNWIYQIQPSGRPQASLFTTGLLYAWSKCFYWPSISLH